MTTNLTPAEARAHNAALKAAAQLINEQSWRFHASVYAKDMASAIRGLSVPIPPEPDVEALVEQCARAMNSAWCYAPEGTPDWGLSWSRHRDQYRKQARAVVAALTAAGMLR